MLNSIVLQYIAHTFVICLDIAFNTRSDCDMTILVKICFDHQMFKHFMSTQYMFTMRVSEFCNKFTDEQLESIPCVIRALICSCTFVM